MAIIGAGFTGLRAALELAQAGSSVVVLDAGDVGWGASGRNGGQVNPMLPFNGPEKLRKLLGTGHFERLAEASLASADDLFATIETHGIACQARQKGWLRVIHSAKAHQAALRDVAEWTAMGAQFEVIEEEPLWRMAGTRAYRSGVVSPRGGAVQPLMLAQGFARAAMGLGARIFGQSPVTGLERQGHGWECRTKLGRVRAAQVIVATNAYSSDLVPGLRRSLLPATPVQIASEPLKDSVINEILPQGHTISDSRRVIMFGRREPDNRIVYGSMGRLVRGGEFGGFDWLRRDAERVYPMLKGVRWEFRWGGHVALTDDHLPHLHEPQPGLLAGFGYNGRGVAMSSVMGRVLAERALGAAPDSLAFPVTPIQPVPWRGIKRLGMGPAIWSMKMMDYLETR
ncbi:NAD(P)/FAD-dependent oxidoreductase [Roseovarius sp. C7]|uniref:NAD(P)/FAD-dependent oxidoreductase n=1 Tax=Roseovarius sp. C7 TaxID=3398643 RepID=UPI0039F65828